MSAVSRKLDVIEAMLVEVRPKLRTAWPPVATAVGLDYVLIELRSLRADVARREERRLEWQVI